MNVLKLILKLILGLMLAGIVCVFLITTLFFSVNGKEQADQEAKFQAQNGRKNALVLYQESRFGLTKEAVDVACSALLEEGYSVTSNHPRADSPYNAQDYDIIVLASPVYAGQVSAPLLSYADRQDFSGKRVMILLTGADLEETAELNAVKETVHGASVIASMKVDQAGTPISDAIQTLADRG